MFPVGFDENFDSYNINADDAACAIAEAVHAEKLAFLSDIEGVYRDQNDPETLISELHVHEARELIDEGFVGGGMIPKLKNCIDAIEQGGKPGAYPGRKDPSQSPSGDLYKQRNRNGNLKRGRRKILQ